MKESIEIKISLKLKTLLRYVATIVFGAALVAGVQYAFATAPNPGHNFTEVGGGVAQGDILYGSAADTLSALADVAAGSYLRSGGVGVAPSWSTPTFPATAGADTNKLLSDGTNWVAATGYVLTGVQIKVNGNTSYAPTSGTNAVLIRMCAGGGGGGGATAAASAAAVGGGGGAGSYLEKFVTFSTTAASYVIAVGGGGGGGTAANGTGSTGGVTTFACDANCSTGTVTFSTNGGLGGVGLASGTAAGGAVGGNGGAASTNGDVNAKGQPGYSSFRTSGTVAFSGAGADSPFGGGGNPLTAAGVGNTGGNYCTGGGGAESTSASGNAGGAGAPGVIVIYEYR